MKRVLSRFLLPALTFLGMAMPASAENATLLGPFGGSGGDSFSACIPEGARIVEVFGRAGDKIDQIGFRWVDAQGALQQSGPFGGNGGDPFSFPILDGFLESVQLSTGSGVDQIELCTSESVCGIFGGNGGSSTPTLIIPNFEVVGFAGSAGGKVDSLGVFFREVPPPAPCTFEAIPSGCQDVVLAGASQVVDSTHNLSYSVLGASPGDSLFLVVGSPTELPLPASNCNLLVAPLFVQTKVATGLLDTFDFEVSVGAELNIDAQIVRFDGLFFDSTNSLKTTCP